MKNLGTLKDLQNHGGEVEMVVKFSQNQIEYLLEQIDIMIHSYNYNDKGILDESESVFLEYPYTLQKHLKDIENLKEKISYKGGSLYSKIERDIIIDRIDLTLDAIYYDAQQASFKRSLISAQKKIQG